jgi:hypothetical protein
VAKCFGLRDSPKTIRVHDDTISKIFNGLYSAALFNDKEAKKKARDEKFSLSKGVKKVSDKPVQIGGNKWRGGASDNNQPKAGRTTTRSDPDAPAPSSSSIAAPSSSSSSVKMEDNSGSYDDVTTNTSKPIPIIIPSDKRKMRIGTKSSSNSSLGGRVLAPSGKFRKSTDGYFKKKLRTQANSEFSA